MSVKPRGSRVVLKVDEKSDPDGVPQPRAVERLRHAIDHAAHLLPAQGPISVFIHHNTLHAFEHLPFEEAVEAAAGVFGCEPYLSKLRYREALARGRIRYADLWAVLDDDLGTTAGDAVPPRGTRFDLRLAMIRHPITFGSDAELRWFLAETDARRKVRADAAANRLALIAETRRWVMRDLRNRNGANPPWETELFARFGESGTEAWDDPTWEAFALECLWNVCHDGMSHAADATPPPAPSVRHRDLLLSATGVDTDLWVHDVLTRFTASFLDQGVSHWPLPDREAGYFRAFCSLYARGGGPPDRWLKHLPAEAARLADVPPLESATESLAALGVDESEWGDYLTAAILALRGWGGMVHQVEQRGDRVAHQIPHGSLHGFVAVRLLLDRVAAEHAAREALDYRGPLDQLRASRLFRTPLSPPTGVQRAVPVFELAQLLGWTPEELSRLAPHEWRALVAEVEAFPEVHRRRIFHRAYERRFREQCLDALALHDRRKPHAPAFQVVTCLDEREESFRRHLEEVAPECETFGAAGFFAVPMYYKGAADAHFVPLCPVVLTPKHWVEEQPDESASHLRAKGTRRRIGELMHRTHVGTRTPIVGALLTATLGVLASVPLFLRVLFPRLAARLGGAVGRIVDRRPTARLVLERSPEREPGDRPGHLGFTPDEMAASAERLLRDIGLTDFAPLVLVLGHGSSSMNNPHKSAYDCGACGGSPGAPNGRAAAHILNDPGVRERLAARGLTIPAGTVFVGGLHNTCNDSVTLFDTDRVPASHRAALDTAVTAVERSCERNAHERCRRFMSAPLSQTPAEARRHVERRSEDLAQTRPELGHATNAICHVGRRERTRGLFLDRRAFLTAYDPTQDDADGTILARTMAAVFPVCGGINLEYFFSHTDPPGYGCGTKLPHNITSLLGVMDGAASDLRTGLPWQMTEIHEPVRLLIVCETTPEVLRKVLDRDTLGKTLTENGWVQLAVQSPTTNEIHLFQNGEFRPYAPRAASLPAAPSSAEWYRGWRDHLEFAEINPAREPHA